MGNGSAASGAVAAKQAAPKVTHFAQTCRVNPLHVMAFDFVLAKHAGQGLLRCRNSMLPAECNAGWQGERGWGVSVIGTSGGFVPVW